MKRVVLALMFAATAGCAFAQNTPAGLWKTIDDETKQEKSFVRITDTGGVLSGKIEKVLSPGMQEAVCDKCSDARKGKPIVGLEIIEGVKKNADQAWWDGGSILDPNNGKTYKLRLTPMEGGKALEVRGYIGPFYRNQTWLRVE
jgi:uncharacterized protein (DUF2147 family)